tara:strand:- start:9098 stop:10198 length:1101 start_codon:yes stop_codon:yes gene_type:complete
MVEDYEALFISRFLKSRLLSWEQAQGVDLEKALGDAATVRQVLNDYEAEGYADYVKAALEPEDAGVRLGRLLEKGPGLMTEPSSAMDGGQLGLLFMAGKSWELPEYVLRLAEIDEVPDIRMHFPSRDAMTKWEGQTRRVLEEMASYLQWIEDVLIRDDTQPVMLLRDTLLICLGLVWKNRYSPKALIFNRTFTNAYAGFEEIYEILIYEALYKSLMSSRELLPLDQLRKEYRECAFSPGVLPQDFIDDTKAQLDQLGLEKPPVFVESGVNGTFPLWLLSYFKDEGGMLLYNTVPWLYELYDGLAYRGYEFLRDVETIVSHNWLFQLDLDCPKTVPSRVRETMDNRTLALAHYEIATFRQLVEGKIS